LQAFTGCSGKGCIIVFQTSAVTSLWAGLTHAFSCIFFHLYGICDFVAIGQLACCFANLLSKIFDMEMKIFENLSICLM
jgi:hypothetical protein